MNVELWLFGVQVMCFTIGPSDSPSPEPDVLRDLGYTSGTYVGFASHVPPEEVSAPQHCPSWDEPAERG